MDQAEFNTYMMNFFADYYANKRGLVVPKANVNVLVIPLDVAQVNKEFFVPGNFLYADRRTNGVVYAGINKLQEDALGTYGFPFAVNTGMKGFPFDRVYLTWAAQANAKIYLWYGYDSEIIPPNQDITTIGSITNPVTVQGIKAMLGVPVVTDQPVFAEDVGYSYGAVQKSGANLAVNGTELIFAAASNTNGAIIWESECFTTPAVPGHIEISLHANTVVPTLYTDGDVLATFGFNVATAAGLTGNADRNIRTKRIAAGKGLWWANFGGQAEAAARRKVIYTLL